MISYGAGPEPEIISIHGSIKTPTGAAALKILTKHFDTNKKSCEK